MPFGFLIFVFRNPVPFGVSLLLSAGISETIYRLDLPMWIAAVNCFTIGLLVSKFWPWDHHV